MLRHIRTTRSELYVKKGGTVTNTARDGADLRFVYGESIQMRKEAGKIIAVLRAVDGGNIAALGILLPQGGDITETTDSGKTALHVAASNVDLEMIGFLLKKPLDRNTKDKAGRLALHHAAMNGHLTELLVITGFVSGCLNKKIDQVH